MTLTKKETEVLIKLVEDAKRDRNLDFIGSPEDELNGLYGELYIIKNKIQEVENIIRVRQQENDMLEKLLTKVKSNG